MRNTKHLVIPDTQIRPGMNLSHIEWAAKFARDFKPDVIVMLGDWYDMASLSSYDKGKKRAEGKRYIGDIKAGNKALDLFEKTLGKFKGRKVITLGNHEQRILRHVEAAPELEGKLSYEDFNFKEHGWEVYDFLKPVRIHGIQYCHYFPRTAKGTVTVNSAKTGASSAENQLKANLCSTTAGHKQGFSYAERPVGAKRIHGLIVGSYYMHDEHYLGSQGNNYFRGLIAKRLVNHSGEYTFDKVDIRELKKKYG